MSCGIQSSLTIQALGLCGLTLLGCGGGSSGQTAQGGEAAGQTASSATPATSGAAGTTSGAKTRASNAGSLAASQTAAATAGTSATATSTQAGMVATAAAAGTGGVPAGDVSNAGSDAAGTSAAAGSGAAGGPAEEACANVIPPSTDCSAKLAPGDHRMCTVGSRQYIVHAGKTMSSCKPVGLVIDAHGASETAPEQFGSEEFCSSGGICWHGLGSGWAAEADAPSGGFIAIFPQGNNNMWAASDADFMLQIVDEMKKVADIDPKKIYMSGISNGGFLTFQTGCPHSDVFSGIAPVSGGSNCTSVKKPIPLISFDGMPDFAYDGHKTANMSVVTANNCKGDAKPWLTIDSNYTEPVCRTAKQDSMATLVPCNTVTSQMIKPTVCEIWDQCDGGVKVVWCDVAPNMEHGESNAALDAHILYENDTLLNIPSVAWRFFKEFW